MRFKGYNFRVSRTVMMLKGYTTSDGSGVSDVPQNGAYVRFGKFCAPNAKGAELTNYTMPPTEDHPKGVPLFAKPLKMTSYSLTNMAYGRDGKVYLAKDGACYTALQTKAQCEGTMLNWKKVPGGLTALLRVPCNRSHTEQRTGPDGTVIDYCDICAQMHDLKLKIEEEASAS